MRTEIVTRRDLSRTVRAVGTIVPDESRLAVIAVKFDGFIEQLLVPTAGVEVRAGEPLARIWIESAEILQEEADLLTALRTGASRGGDVAGTEHNLRLFGIPNQVIEQLKRTGQPVRSIVLNAPVAGTVLEQVSFPAGTYVTESGQFEYLARAGARLKIVIPITLLVILLLLYLNFRRMTDTLIVMLSLPFSLVGGLWLMAWMGFNMSVASTVGFVALAGVAAETAS